MTPIEEVMCSLDELIRCGKVLYVGMSDAPAVIVDRGQHNFGTPGLVSVYGPTDNVQLD